MQTLEPILSILEMNNITSKRLALRKGKALLPESGISLVKLYSMPTTFLGKYPWFQHLQQPNMYSLIQSLLLTVSSIESQVLLVQILTLQLSLPSFYNYRARLCGPNLSSSYMLANLVPYGQYLLQAQQSCVGFYESCWLI